MKESQMESKHINRNRRMLVFMGMLIPLLLAVGIQYHLPQRFVIPALMLVLLAFATVGLWLHANIHANGGEWWQDDHCDGWRGY